MTLLALADGRLVRGEAIVLLVVFGAWLVALGRETTRARAGTDDELRLMSGHAVWQLLVGLVALIGAGRLVVIAAKGIGDDWS